MTSQLVIQYTAEKNYVMGADLKILVTMKNSGEQNILIHKPLTSSGLLRYDLFSNDVLLGASSEVSKELQLT